MRDHGRYEVGFKKTPVHTRFKKGQSGNPEGRPKHARLFDYVLKTELDTVINLTIDGKPRSISKREAMIRHLFAKALRGDIRAIEMFLQHAGKRDRQYPQPPYIIKYYKESPKGLPAPPFELTNLDEVSSNESG
jgi:Family of unknown function (DUF5681)